MTSSFHYVFECVPVLACCSIPHWAVVTRLESWCIADFDMKSSNWWIFMRKLAYVTFYRLYISIAPVNDNCRCWAVSSCRIYASLLVWWRCLHYIFSVVSADISIFPLRIQCCRWKLNYWLSWYLYAASNLCIPSLENVWWTCSCRQILICLSKHIHCACTSNSSCWVKWHIYSVVKMLLHCCDNIIAGCRQLATLSTDKHLSVIACA